MIDDNSGVQVGVALREAAGHLRLRGSLAEAARRGAARRLRRRRAGVASACALVVAVSGTAVALWLGRSGTRGPAPDVPAATATATASAAATREWWPEGCTVHRLPVPGNDPKSLVTGGDPTGRYLALRGYRNGKIRTSIWDGSVSRAAPISGDDAAWNDVNSAGDAAGSSFVTHDTEAAWAYLGGVVVRLPGADTEATAINAQGLIAGARNVPERITTRPVVWRSTDKPAEDLPMPAGAYGGKVVDVADDGTIVGMVWQTKRVVGTGYLWRPDGGYQKIPLPVIGGRQVTEFWVDSVHGSVIDGKAFLDDANGSQVIAWATFDIRSGAFTPLPQKQVGNPTGNGRGWLAGDSPTGTVLTRPDGAGGVDTVDLPGLVPLSGNVVADHLNMPIAVVLGSDGRIVAGQAKDANGEPQAVIWRCA